MSRHIPQPAELEVLGLSRAAASVYLQLVIRGPLGAQALSEMAGIPRSSVYPALRSLADRGLVEAAVGYGSRYRAVPPEQAMESLVEEQREHLYEQEIAAKELGSRLSAIAGENLDPEAETVEIVRDPRALAERFKRLHTEVREEIVNFTKMPVIITKRGNPLFEKALKRGVRAKSIYEEGFLEESGFREGVKRFQELGEESRIWNGELPMKLTLFDARNSLSSLSSTTGDITTLAIRNPGLGSVLRAAFETYWTRATPL